MRFFNHDWVFVVVVILVLHCKFLNGSHLVIQLFSSLGPSLQRYLTTILAECTGATGSNLRPWYGTIPCGDLPTTWYRIDCFGLLPARNGKWLCPQGNETYSGCWICFSCFQCLFQHQYQETFGVLCSPSRYSIQYCFWLKNLLQSKRRAAVGSYNSLILPYTAWPRSRCLNRDIECLPGLLDTVPAERHEF